MSESVWHSLKRLGSQQRSAKGTRGGPACRDFRFVWDNAKVVRVSAMSCGWHRMRKLPKNCKRIDSTLIDNARGANGHGGGERQRGGAWPEVLGAANCQSIQIHRHGHRMSVPSSLFSAQWRFMLLRLRPLPSPLPRFAPSTLFVRRPCNPR